MKLLLQSTLGQLYGFEIVFFLYYYRLYLELIEDDYGVKGWEQLEMQFGVHKLLVAGRAE